MTPQDPRLSFHVIDVDRHADLCVTFRADSFAVSFGDAVRFHGGDGKGADRYLRWLSDAIRDFPGGHAHAWFGDEIVGQVEMRPLESPPAVGYVYLYYLTLPWRGIGVAGQLDAYATGWLRDQGCRTARLSVSDTNKRAIRFYLRQGWRDAGPRPGHRGERVMERDL